MSKQKRYYLLEKGTNEYLAKQLSTGHYFTNSIDETKGYQLTYTGKEIGKLLIEKDYYNILEKFKIMDADAIDIIGKE